MIKTIPYVSEKLYKTAILSASIVMPEGGINLISEKLNTIFNSEYFELVDNKNENTTDKNNDNSIDNDKKSEQLSENNSSQYSSTTSQRPENAGNIIRKTYGGGTSDKFIQLANNAFIKNSTNIERDKIISEIKGPVSFKITKDNSPQVLIMHTHATESYESETRDYYIKGTNSRTKDNEKNVVRIGAEIAKQFQNSGIGVLHDKTQHDNPSYNGSYERSESTVKSYLKKYPSIKVVLDVHRDAIQQDDETMIAPIASINGKNAAQVMIISGADNGKLGYPNYMNNLRFSRRLQEQIEADYKGLTRPIAFTYKKYNQHLTNGSILLEMGGHGNSLEEAIYLGELVGKSLVKLLSTLN